jgi:arylsulfatase A-like enzyme
MNVICICLDTFRADIIGPGKKMSFVKTPNLDAFAEEAVVFDQAFGEGQPTLQTRRSLFTGQRTFPWRFNFDRRGHWHHAPGWHKIPPDQDTLAEILVSRGYLTGMVADTYHMFKPTMNYTRGFVTYDFIRGQESDNWRYGTRAAIEDLIREHVREPINWDRHAGLMQYLFNQRFRQQEEDYSCARVFRRAADWLAENAENSPFFLWVDSFDPHEPWDPPKEYADQYMPDWKGKDFITPGAANEGDGPTDAEQERTKALYFGEVTLVDRWVGHLLEQVDRMNLWDDTVVMVLSDHGTQVLDHGHFGKGAGKLHPFNTQLNWMVRHPDVSGGRHIPGFVQSHDLMPTVLKLLGIPCGSVDGLDVWSLVTEETEAVRDHVVIGWAEFSNGPAKGRASVRDRKWNYTVSLDKPENQELFDLGADPEEIQNVASNYPDVVKQQRTRVEAVIQQQLPAVFLEVCDPGLSPGAMYLKGKQR